MTRPKNFSGDSIDKTANQSRKLVNFFNLIAPRYDMMNTLLSFGLHFLWRRETIKQAEIKKESMVLDLCGGTGDLSILAAESYSENSLLIYDFSPGMIARGMEKIKKRGLSDKINFICGDVEDIAAQDKTFDIVITGFGLRNIVDREKVLAESFRVLKQGGSFICLEFSTPMFPPFVFLYNLYSRYAIPFLGSVVAGSRKSYRYLVDSINAFPPPEEIVSLFEEAGFEQVSFKRLCLGVAAIHKGFKPEK